MDQIAHGFIGHIAQTGNVKKKDVSVELLKQLIVGFVAQVVSRCMGDDGGKSVGCQYGLEGDRVQCSDKNVFLSLGVGFHADGV